MKRLFGFTLIALGVFFFVDWAAGTRIATL